MEDDQEGKMYSEGIMSVAPRDFGTWGIQLHKNLKTSDEQLHKV